MVTSSNTKKKPSKSGADFISAAELMRHAAALIKFDKDNALAVQSPTESVNTGTRSSSLEESFGKSGQVGLKVKSEQDDLKETKENHKITPISKKKESKKKESGQ